jgi:hypothetical protein
MRPLSTPRARATADERPGYLLHLSTSLLFPDRRLRVAIGLSVDLDRDDRIDAQPPPPFRLRFSNDPPSLVPSVAIAQVFELLIGTATPDLDLFGRSVCERQLQDVRHVARNAA